MPILYGLENGPCQQNNTITYTFEANACSALSDVISANLTPWDTGWWIDWDGVTKVGWLEWDGVTLFPPQILVDAANA